MSLDLLIMSGTSMLFLSFLNSLFGNSYKVKITKKAILNELHNMSVSPSIKSYIVSYDGLSALCLTNDNLYIALFSGDKLSLRPANTKQIKLMQFFPEQNKSLTLHFQDFSFPRIVFRFSSQKKRILWQQHLEQYLCKSKEKSA